MLPNRMMLAHTSPLAAILLMVSTTCASSLSITVLNHSFETQPVPMDGNSATRSDGDDYVVATPANWMDPVGSTFKDGSLTGTAGSYFEDKLEATPDPSDNDQSAWSNGNAIYQVLSATLLPNSVYTLTADLGDRSDTDFAAGTKLRLGVGDTFGAGILTPDAVASPTPPNGTWATWENVYSTGPDPDGLSQLLRVELISGGSQANFDDVRVTVVEVPEPASWALSGLALLALGCVGRRVQRRMVEPTRHV